MTEQELHAKIHALEGQLVDAKVDLNISEDKRRKLERELADANRRIRELERDTMAVQTLSLEGDEEDFNPYETGRFRSGWNGGTR